MEKLINNLIAHYEKGGMSRRELVGALAVLAVGTQSASAAGFESNTINHVSITVSDLKRSVDWYQRTFGLSLMRQDTNVVQLSVGRTQHLSIRQVQREASTTSPSASTVSITTRLSPI